MRPSNRFCRLGAISSGWIDGKTIARPRCEASNDRIRSSPSASSGSNSDVPASGPWRTRRGSAPMNVGVITIRPSNTIVLTHRWCPSICQPHGSPSSGEPKTETKYGHSPNASRSPVSSASSSLSRMIERAWWKPRADIVARSRSSAELTHRRGEVLEHHAVSEVVHVDVDPHPPLGRIDRERRSPALLGGERLQEGGGRIGDRSRCPRARRRAIAGPVARCRRWSRRRTARRGGPLARRRCRGSAGERAPRGCAPTSTAATRSRTAATRHRRPSSPLPPIGVLTVFASCGTSGAGGRMSASTASTSSRISCVGEHPRRRVEPGRHPTRRGTRRLPRSRSGSSRRSPTRRRA